MTPLPVYTVLSEIKNSLADQNRAILCAPPGSGKTTVVPPALLDESWLTGQRILMLEPRRIAAKNAASFMASEQGESVGQKIGYRVRFDRQVSSQTRIEVVTGGVFLRQIQNDPELTGVGLVIFDEFHERSLETDLALALCLDAQEGLREDLRLLVMSATLDTASLQMALQQAPCIQAQGTVYPVQVKYSTPQVHQRRPGRNGVFQREDIARTCAQGISQALEEEKGDILAFLPGLGEIRKTMAQLERRISADVLLLPLHGSFTLREQQQAILPDPQGRRRVILATTIAESSLTIEGIAVVVDTGWKRIPRFDTGSGLTRLETVRISKASAEQRRGRAGRLGPGICYRLWETHVDQGLLDFDRPEILQADLASLVLELSYWGVQDAGSLRWLDSPSPQAITQAEHLLCILGCLERSGENHPLRLTALGRKVVQMPVHPRLACMLIQAEAMHQLDLACDLAALLSERDIRQRSSSQRSGQSLPEASGVDLEMRLQTLNDMRQREYQTVQARGYGIAACKQVLRISAELKRRFSEASTPSSTHLDTAAMQNDTGILLALAYPDRIAQQDAAHTATYTLSSGQKVALPEYDPLLSSPFLIVGAIGGKSRMGQILLAAEISQPEIETLFASRIIHQEEYFWHPQAEAVKCRRLSRLDTLILQEQPAPVHDREKIRSLVLTAIREKGRASGESSLAMLPWTKKSRQTLARLQAMSHWLPDEDWPDCSEPTLLATLEDWLGPYLEDVSSRAGLKELDLHRILLDRLSWDQQMRLDMLAPTHFTAPSGSRIPLQYAGKAPPVLAVRIQEMFGLAESPTLCQGKAPVVLHLLSPASRPVQITTDLAAFWQDAYHEVKKDLKGRYPKHYWPDLPLQAQATARAKLSKKKP